MGLQAEIPEMGMAYRLQAIAQNAAIVAIFALAAYLIRNRIGIVADGSFFLLNDITYGTVFDGGQPSRIFADAITQAPVLFAALIPAVGVRALAYLQTVGLVLFPSIIWAATLFRLRGSGFFWIVFCLYCTSFLNTVMFPISEANLSLAMFVSLVAFLLMGAPKSNVPKTFMVLLALALIASYASTAFTGLIVIWAAFCHLRDFHSCRMTGGILAALRTEWWLSLIIAFATISVVVGLEASFNPANMAERNGSLSWGVILHNSQLLITCASGAFYFAAVAFRRFPQITIPLGIIAAAGLVFFLLNERAMSDTLLQYFGSKTILCFYVAAMVSGLILLRGQLRWHTGAVTQMGAAASASIPLLLFAATAIPAVQNAHRFGVFAAEMRQIVDTHTGIIDVTATTLPQYVGYYWTYPFLSIIVADKPGAAIILYPEMYPHKMTAAQFPDISVRY